MGCIGIFWEKETTWTHISECESMVCRRLGWIFMDGCFCIVYCMCIFYDWDILLWDVCVEDLGILYVFVYMLYVYIVCIYCIQYTCMVLSVRCMLCAEDWDWYIVCFCIFCILYVRCVCIWDGYCILYIVCVCVQKIGMDILYFHKIARIIRPSLIFP